MKSGLFKKSAYIFSREIGWTQCMPIVMHWLRLRIIRGCKFPISAHLWQLVSPARHIRGSLARGAGQAGLLVACSHPHCRRSEIRLQITSQWSGQLRGYWNATARRCTAWLQCLSCRLTSLAETLILRKTRSLAIAKGPCDCCINVEIRILH